MSLRRKIAVVGVVLASVAAAVWIAAAVRPTLPAYSYSQFLDRVHSGQVASAVILGGDSGAVDATFRLKDGAAARTVLPGNYRDALLAMRERLVNVEIRRSPWEPRRLIVNAAPFLVLLGVWVLLMIRGFPGGFRPIFPRQR